MALLNPSSRVRNEWNDQLGRFAPTDLSPDAYDAKYAANSARGAFPTFGRVDSGDFNSASADEQGFSAPPRASIAALKGGGSPAGLPWDPGRSDEGNIAHQNALREMDNTSELAMADKNAELERQRTNENYDIGTGRPSMRAEAAGAPAREQAMSNARNTADIYFDPRVAAQRQDQFYQQMEQLRRRYSDPAVVKGQAEEEAARIRGQFGLARQGETNTGNLDVQNARNQGNAATADTRARASVGAAVAGQGGNADQYIPPAPGANQANSMTEDELLQFATEKQMPLSKARALAESSGYTIR